MAIEAKRGCGYRKVGGLYIVSGGLAEHCHRLPFPLDVCRGWTWIEAIPLFGERCGRLHQGHCPICYPLAQDIQRYGLLWIGERYYPTPQAFGREALAQGVSRRIASIPSRSSPRARLRTKRP